MCSLLEHFGEDRFHLGRTTAQPLRIVIVGAGIAGLTAGIGAFDVSYVRSYKPLLTVASSEPNGTRSHNPRGCITAIRDRSWHPIGP